MQTAHVRMLYDPFLKKIRFIYFLHQLVNRNFLSTDIQTTLLHF
jgi:hypothetical protein